MKRMCQILQKRCSGTIRKTWVTQALLFFLLVPALQTQANNFLQDYKLSVSMSDVSIKSAIEEIKRQTNLSFVYNELDLRDAGYVDLNFKNSDVHSVLDHILKNTRLHYDIIDNVIVIKRESRLENYSPQTKKRTVKGVVTDDNKSPLPGVAVKVKGLNVGVATDINGRYELMVDDTPSTTLQFSFVGMKSHEEKIGTRTQIDLQMESTSTGLDEVMVVAYGTTKKEAFTGSAVSVKGDKIMNAAASQVSPERALQGVVAGVRFSRGGGQPGEEATVQIRGISSKSQATTPLYIIDGVPFESGLTMINPNDIETMTVLKDAAATSLYGSRAANGVVIISTKQGQEGKTRFEAAYESAWSYEAIPKAIKGHWMDAGALTDYSLEALKNKWLNDRDYLPWQDNYNPNDPQIQNQARQYALRNLHSMAGIVHPDDPYDGSFNYSNLTDAQLEKYVTNPRNYDWYDAIFQRGREHKFNLSARGGGKALNYFTSLGYVNQKGIAKGSSFERYTTRMALNNKVSKIFNFSFNQGLAYTVQKTNTTSGTYYNNPIYGMRLINPTKPIYLPNGKLNEYPGWDNNIPNYITNLSENLVTRDRFSSISNLSVQVNFTDWLNFKTVNGVDFNYSQYKQIWTSKSKDGKPTAPGVSGGHVNKSTSFSTNIVSSNTLNFNKSFDKHNVSALVGYEAKNYQWQNLEATGKNFPSDKLMYLDNAATPNSIGEWKRQERLISYISKVDYNYDNTYFLSGSYRRDGTSRLLKDNRWGNFWSVSGAWNITKENFLQNTSDWLDNLRLKLSYGTNGTQPNDRDSHNSFFLSQTLYNVDGKYAGNPAVYVNNYGNADLTWESSYTWNAGVDVSLWGGKLKATVEYYNKLTKNLIDEALTPWMSGWEKLTVNEGEIRNTGVEVTIDSRNFNRDDFTWTTNFNISYMKAVFERLKDSKIEHPYITKQGEHLYSFYTREWVGVDSETGQGTWKLNTKDENGNVIDGTSTTHNNLLADRVIVGKGYPDFYGGLTNSFTYKSFELSFLLTFTLGGDLYDSEHYYAVPDGNGVGNTNFRADADDSYWKKPGDAAKDPIVIYKNPYNSSANTSSRRVMSSDHMKIKNITFGYNLPKQWVQKIGLSNAKIYVNGNDVYTFYKNKYLNPETGIDGMARDTGWPSLKSWRIGINVQF